MLVSYNLSRLSDKSSVQTKFEKWFSSIEKTYFESDKLQKISHIELSYGDTTIRLNQSEKNKNKVLRVLALIKELNLFSREKIEHAKPNVHISIIGQNEEFSTELATESLSQDTRLQLLLKLLSIYGERLESTAVALKDTGTKNEN